MVARRSSREAVEHAVADQSGERVGDRAVREGHQREGHVLERLELAPRRLPHPAVLDGAVEAGVHGQRHPGLLEPGPDRVVVRHPRRLVAAAGRHRSGDGAHHAGTHPQQPLQFGRGHLGVGEGEHRNRVDAAVAVEAPVLVEPGVERAEGGVEGFEVALEGLLHAHALGGEQQHRLQALLVHQLHPGVAVAEAGMVVEGVELAEHGRDVAALQVAAPEVVLEAARLGDRVEGRVGDELVDLAGHHEPLAAVDGGPLHAALLHRRVDVADEGVGGLVVVLVHVERLEVQCWRHGSMIPSTPGRWVLSPSPFDRRGFAPLSVARTHRHPPASPVRR